MKKDVIYIDIEDDITAVIDKLKKSKERIIALVPPKGNAVLQSIVNLKLLKRAADNVDKQPVVVTNNKALIALAGGIGMYVAKNLQSKPEVPVTSSDEPSDTTMEVSDDDQVAEEAVEASPVDVDDDEVELSETEVSDIEKTSTDAVAAEKLAEAKKPVKDKRVPNFGAFRKKLLVIGGLVLLALVFLIAFFGRTKAQVTLRAETSPVDVAFEAKLNADFPASDPKAFNLKALRHETKKSLAQAFQATGEKDAGAKATGNMTFSIRCSDVDGAPPTIPAGTGVSANGLTFITNKATSLTNASFSPCRFTGSTTVSAQNNGDQYNLSPRDYSVSGFSSVTARGSQMSGGVTKMIKVVSQADVDKAKTALTEQNSAPARDELKKAFGQDARILEDSFTATIGAISSEPAVGQEANEATLRVEIVYSMLAMANADINAALDAFIAGKMPEKEQQKVYENGYKDMKLERVASDAKTGVYKISSLGYYGPEFDIDKLKSDITGKKLGEARSQLSELPGVKGIDLKTSPFWARKMPNPGRITIELEVDRNVGG